tara:strand:+ start:88 stop:285 length:198 start_codon:yes stop_codon:yes gene_type:complete
MTDKLKKIDIKKTKDEIFNLKKTLMNYNFQKSTGQLEKTAEIKKTRKKIARLKYEISKNLGGSDA